MRLRFGFDEKNGRSKGWKSQAAFNPAGDQFVLFKATTCKLAHKTPKLPNKERHTRKACQSQGSSRGVG